MRYNSFARRIFLVSLAVSLSAGLWADIVVDRHPLWGGAEELVRQKLDGFVVPAKSTTDWKGFVDEGDRIRGEFVGHSFSYVVDKEGAYYLGLILVDDPDGTETLEVSLNGKALGTILASESGGKALFAFQEAVDLKPGDVLQYTSRKHVGYYRIYSLLFAKQRIAPPPPAFENIVAWSPAPGAVDICWTTTTVAPTGYLLYGDALKTPFVDYVGRNHRIHLVDLDPTRDYEGRLLSRFQDKEITSAPFHFKAMRPLADPTSPLSIPLTITEPTDTARRAWPASIGMPFAKGVLAQESDLRLFDAQGQAQALQTDTTCRWDDGSVKWVTLSFLADTKMDAETAYLLKAQPAWEEAAPVAEALSQLESTATGWMVQTENLSFRIPTDKQGLFRDLKVAGLGESLGQEARLVAQAPKLGELIGGSPKADSFVVEENGPCRTVLKWTGDLMQADDKKSGWSYVVRMRLWKGKSTIGLNVTLYNNLDKPEFRELSSLAVALPSGATKPLAIRLENPESSLTTASGDFSLIQDKDNHFILDAGDASQEGERATGLMSASTAEARLSLFMPDFWQTYPSGLQHTAEGLEAQLLPPLAPTTYDDEASRAIFASHYAWFDQGNYLFRAGQASQAEVFLSYGPAGSVASAAQESAWWGEALLPQAPPAYLCETAVLGRPLYPRTEGIWDQYDDLYDRSYDNTMANVEAARTYGWMHYGDWMFGGGCSGNNEYDLAWSTGVQWMRTAQRRYFLRGLKMARHYSTIDTIHGDFSDTVPCLVWKHCFNHVGSYRPVRELIFDEEKRKAGTDNFSYFHGGRDPMGHIFEEGMWLYGVLTGDRWFLDAANHVCSWQARSLTPSFDFEIERSGGWALICAVRSYGFSGNPYYLNAARIMVQRCLERHDPDHGGWPHTPPLGETLDKPVRGGKAFATAILSHGLMRYLEVESEERPEVRQMLVNTADWLMTESWAPSGGFVYITNSPKHYDKGGRGVTSMMLSEIFAYALEVTGEEKYGAFWQESMKGTLDGHLCTVGKNFSQQTRQSVFGLDRAWRQGIKTIPPLEQ